MEEVKYYLSLNKLAIIVGLGLVLLSLHNSWFIFHRGSDVAIFLPQWGFAIIGLSSIMLYATKKFNKSYIPRKEILIPSAIIITFVCIRAIMDNDDRSIAHILFILSMPLVYALGKHFGLKTLYPLIITSVIVSISVIICSLLNVNPSIRNGGIISLTNYAFGQAFIFFGTLAGLYLIKNIKLKALLLTINIIGLVFTGSPEAVLSIALLIGWIVIKRDYHPILKYSIITIYIVSITWFAFGDGTKQYDRVNEVTTFVTSGDIVEENSWDNNTIEDEKSWGIGRLPAYKKAITDINFFGHGYYIYSNNQMSNKQMTIDNTTIHNVPLVILYQIGLIPALAWIFLTGYCLFKYEWKLFWLGMLVLGLFNHTTWTVMIPYYCLLIGITTNFEGKKYLFKGG